MRIWRFDECENGFKIIQHKLYLGKVLRSIQEKFSSVYCYLHLTLWVWLTAVFTLYNPPLARDTHVFTEVFPFQCNLTVCIGAGNRLERAGCQVSLSENQHALVKIICLQLISSSPSMLSKASHLVDADVSWALRSRGRGDYTLHEKSPLSRDKCVVKGLLRPPLHAFDDLWCASRIIFELTFEGVSKAVKAVFTHLWHGFDAR